MKLAIMQPYLFPYIGYWQLINAVDTFVIYDDVNFIKQGYINRNNILVNNKSQRFTLELVGASSNKLINEINVGRNAIKVLKTIKQNYQKAPYFSDVYPLIEKILLNPEKNLAKYLTNTLIAISQYLELNTKFMISSELNKDSNLTAQNKVLNICKVLNATTYINAIGGQELYDREIFKIHDLELRFLETNTDIVYKQFNDEFISNLSIIDVLMFNSISEIKNILEKYKLVKGKK